MQDYRKLYIDGAWVDPAGTDTIDVINAATEEVMGSIPAGTAEDIDRAMELGYNHPMGPLRLTDLVGLDVRLGIAEYLASTLGPRFDPPRLLQEMVAAGKLGRKTGQGFYSWNEE